MTGQRVGNWVLGEEVGRGPTGVVYAARAADDPGRAAAVKVVPPDPARGPAFLAKFPAEMLALRRLNHPNVAKFFDAGVLPGGGCWYASELVDGPDCGALLKARPRTPDEPGLSWKDEVVSIAAQAARGLKHGHHRSLLHRSLKPTNVLVARDGTVKLTDFGVAKLFAPSALALPPDPAGTAGFLAPEHWTGKPLTRRSDLYALGGVAYALLTGRPPFTGATAAEFLHKHCYTLPDRPARFVKDLPADLDDLVCGLLAKDPNRRPAAAAGVIEDLDSVRGKAERKGKKVHWPADPGDASGPLPALAADAGRDPGDDRPRPLMSRPAVVVPLFLLVAGVLLALVVWPGPDPAALVEGARPLMASDDPADWDKADALLARAGADGPEVAAYRAKVADRRRLRRAVDEGRRAEFGSDADRLYHRGLAQARAGDPAAARRTWEAVARAFAGVEAEARWVDLARAGAAELAKGPAPPPADRPGVAAAVGRARALKADGKSGEAAAVLDALEDLYRDDPAALDQVRKAREP